MSASRNDFVNLAGNAGLGYLVGRGFGNGGAGALVGALARPIRFNGGKKRRSPRRKSPKKRKSPKRKSPRHHKKSPKK